MKKLTKGLALLFSGVVIQTFAALPTGVPNNIINLPRFCGGTTFGLTAMFLRPSITSLNYALVYPRTDDAGNIIFDEGVERNTGSDYTWGLSVNVGYIYPCSADDVIARLTHFGRDDRRVAFDPDDGNLLPSVSDSWRDGFIVASSLPAITGVVDGTLVTLFPAQLIVPPVIHADVAAAKTSFDYTAFDLDFGRTVNLGRRLRVHLHGGLRYAELDNKLNVTIFGNRSITTTQSAVDSGEDVPTTITFATTSNVTEHVNQKGYFQGIGPRIGFDSSYHVLCHFGLVADFSSGLIIGKQHSSLLEEFNESSITTVTDLTPGSAEGTPTTDISAPVGTVFTSSESLSGELPNRVTSFTTDHEVRIVPNLEAKLGANYTIEFCNCSHTLITIEAGWMATHYFNLLDRSSLVAVHSPELRTRQTFDMSFQGPYVGVQVNL